MKMLAVVVVSIAVVLGVSGAVGTFWSFPELCPVVQEVDVAKETGNEDDWQTEASRVSYENMKYYWQWKPELRPLIKQAMSDGRLTATEALGIYNVEQRNNLLGVMKEEEEE